MNPVKSTIIILLLLTLAGSAANAQTQGSTAQIAANGRYSKLVYQNSQLGMAMSNQFAADQTSGVFKDSQGTERKLNRQGALLRSLIMPGWGESYLGYKNTGRAFFWTDVAIWTGVVTQYVYGQWREDQFISYAATHSGAHMSGRSDKYYADIGNYNNTDEYNQAKLLNRDFDALYNDPSYFWAWDAEGNRLEYDHTRIQSRSAKNRMYFFIGAAALNRLISLVDTGKKASALLKRQKTGQLGLSVEPTFANSSNEIRLVLTAGF
ncbi:MAG: hypothetical protein NTW14_06785 [bacterium]|nr:hypothetical protein [bacterium]